MANITRSSLLDTETANRIEYSSKEMHELLHHLVVHESHPCTLIVLGSGIIMTQVKSAAVNAMFIRVALSSDNKLLF